ncbi:Transcriptional regulator, partial [Dysosmobacter welbionis]
AIVQAVDGLSLFFDHLRFCQNITAGGFRCRGHGVLPYLVGLPNGLANLEALAERAGDQRVLDFLTGHD